MSDKTKFQKFLDKAKAIVPDVVSVGAKALSGNYIGAIQDVGNLLKRNQKRAKKQKFYIKNLNFKN